MQVFFNALSSDVRSFDLKINVVQILFDKILTGIKLIALPVLLFSIMVILFVVNKFEKHIFKFNPKTFF